MQFDPVIPITAALILSYVFVIAGIHKWRNIREFKTTLADYRILPDYLLDIFAYGLPAMELLTGVALLFPDSSHLAALCAGALLLMYMCAIAVNLAVGRRTIDCGCGGGDQKQVISEGLLLRNGVLLFLAYSITLAADSRALVWFDWFVVFLATMLGCLFYNIFNQLLVNRDLLKALRSHHG